MLCYSVNQLFKVKLHDFVCFLTMYISFLSLFFFNVNEKYLFEALDFQLSTKVCIQHYKFQPCNIKQNEVNKSLSIYIDNINFIYEMIFNNSIL